MCTSCWHGQGSPLFRTCRGHTFMFLGTCTLTHGVYVQICINILSVIEFTPHSLSERPDLLPRRPKGKSKHMPFGGHLGKTGGHLPCRVSYCRICTSSTQSAGNQPVRPFTVPSQNPPSPMLSTRKRSQTGCQGKAELWGTRFPAHLRLWGGPQPQPLLSSQAHILLAFFPGKIL